MKELFLVCLSLILVVHFTEGYDDIPKRDVADFDDPQNHSAPCNQRNGNCGRNTCSGSSCLQTSCSGQCSGCSSGRCCDGTNCNICHGGNCCKSKTCNNCFRQCRSTCQYSSCYGNCYSNCLQGRSNCHRNDIQCNKNQEEDIEVHIQGPKARRIYNVTTLINITNLINNTNEIESPVVVNNTNLNNYNYTLPTHPQQGVPLNPVQTCCYVLHPPQCYQTPQGPTCSRKKQRICGSVCFSRPSPEVTQPPQPKPDLQPQVKCYNMHHYPYVYCPDSTQPNCDVCYNCPGLTPGQCIQTPRCPPNCKNALTPPVQPQSGNTPQHVYPIEQSQLPTYQINPVVPTYQQSPYPVTYMQPGPQMPSQQIVYTLGQTAPVGQSLSIGNTLPIGQTIPIAQTIPIGQTLPIGQTIPMGQTLQFGQTLPIGQTIQLGQTGQIPLQANGQPSQLVVLGNQQPSLSLPVQGFQGQQVVLLGNQDGTFSNIADAQTLNYLAQLLKLGQPMNGGVQPAIAENQDIVEPAIKVNSPSNFNQLGTQDLSNYKLIPVQINGLSQLRSRETGTGQNQQGLGEENSAN